jgi:hypothetical protein
LDTRASLSDGWVASQTVDRKAPRKANLEKKSKSRTRSRPSTRPRDMQQRLLSSHRMGVCRSTCIWLRLSELINACGPVSNWRAAQAGTRTAANFPLSVGFKFNRVACRVATRGQIDGALPHGGSIYVTPPTRPSFTPGIDGKRQTPCPWRLPGPQRHRRCRGRRLKDEAWRQCHDVTAIIDFLP